ncbi:hypothetical protein Tco_0868427 [Tanacetum coccineum]
MTTLKFNDTHNMVAFLFKPTESDGFEQIVDFLNAHSIRHALTINPKIYISYIKQFWSTIKVKTINGEVQLHALVNGKKIIITESTVRRDLQLEDAEGVDCLPNSTIFEQLALMGSKTTAWNEFSITMTSAIICLATNQKFNFSKYIFEKIGGGPRVPRTMGDTTARIRVLDLEKTKITQANEITSLKRASESKKNLHHQSKDKGKGIMIEEPVKPMKKKVQIMLDEEVASK